MLFGNFAQGHSPRECLVPRFCVYCFYEAVDTMPPPEFRRSFPIGRTIFVLTFRMRSVVPIRGGSNQSMMSKYYPITTRLRKLLTLPPTPMRTVAFRTRDFQHLIRKVARNRRELNTHQSPFVSTIRANCL